MLRLLQHGDSQQCKFPSITSPCQCCVYATTQDIALCMCNHICPSTRVSHCGEAFVLLAWFGQWEEVRRRYKEDVTKVLSSQCRFTFHHREQDHIYNVGCRWHKEEMSDISQPNPGPESSFVWVRATLTPNKKILQRDYTWRKAGWLPHRSCVWRAYMPISLSLYITLWGIITGPLKYPNFSSWNLWQDDSPHCGQLL